MTGNLKLFELKKLEDTRMKIVIINGSARKGNTLTAINAFIKGASEKNEIEIIEPDKLNIAPCRGCGVCQCSKGCVDKDDTNPTIDKIAAADMIPHQFRPRERFPQHGCKSPFDIGRLIVRTG